MPASYPTQDSAQYQPRSRRLPTSPAGRRRHPFRALPRSVNRWRTLWAAARAPFPPFQPRLIGSVLRLLSADRRFIDPHGRVVTEIGHTWRWGSLFVLACAPSLIGLVYAIVTVQIPLLIVTTLVGFASGWRWAADSSASFAPGIFATSLRQRHGSSVTLPPNLAVESEIGYSARSSNSQTRSPPSFNWKSDQQTKPRLGFTSDMTSNSRHITERRRFPARSERV